MVRPPPKSIIRRARSSSGERAMRHCRMSGPDFASHPSGSTRDTGPAFQHGDPTRYRHCKREAKPHSCVRQLASLSKGGSAFVVECRPDTPHCQRGHRLAAPDRRSYNDSGRALDCLPRRPLNCPAGCLVRSGAVAQAPQQMSPRSSGIHAPHVPFDVRPFRRATKRRRMVDRGCTWSTAMRTEPLAPIRMTGHSRRRGIDPLTIDETGFFFDADGCGGNVAEGGLVPNQASLALSISRANRIALACAGRCRPRAACRPS